MKNIIIILILSLIFQSDILAQNKKDKNGLKQGVWKEGSKQDFTYKTYKNDTLNGLYYTKKDTTIQRIGYYKKGECDSIWLMYYDNGNLFYRANYKNGRQNGLFLEFYKDSKLKTEKYYENDKLIKELSYYPNMKIESYYSYPIRYTYYKNGRVHTKQIALKNVEPIDSIYDEKGNLRYPGYFQHFKIDLDTTIINNSKCKITCLFSRLEKEIPNQPFYMIPIYVGAKYFNIDTVLNVVFDDGDYACASQLIQVTQHTTKCSKLNETNFGKKITAIEYSTNWEKQMIDGEMCYVPASGIKVTKHKLDFGQIIISQQNLCNDTGRNLVEIKTRSGVINFKNTYNIAIFELDLNKDNKKELYLVSYQTCMGYVTIYRIDNE